jgi:hypothetical protein
MPSISTAIGPLLAMAVLGLVACGGSDSGGPGGTGSITLPVPTQSPDSYLLLSIRILLRGPTDTSVTVDPGGEATIAGLEPGSYTVTVEGYSSGTEFYGFGQRADVTVTPGNETRTSVPLGTFLSTVTLPADTVRGKELQVSFDPVPGATEYEVLANIWYGQFIECCLGIRTTGTTATVPVPAYEQYVVRVRAFDAFGAAGRYSDVSDSVVVRPRIVPLFACDAGGEADRTTRGFYVSNFPGRSIATVDLHVSADAAGTYDLSLTTRENSFEGGFLGSPAATVTLGADSLAFQKVTFSYAESSFLPLEGTTVVFALRATGPGNVYFEVPHDDPACPVLETDDQTFPLSTVRRHGVRLAVVGGEP